MTRQKHALNAREAQEFKELCALRDIDPDDVQYFWWRAALARGLDPGSIISDAPSFTGLPTGHGRHWCWPAPLACKQRPEEVA
jgi:hypothetical protein